MACINFTTIKFCCFLITNYFLFLYLIKQINAYLLVIITVKSTVFYVG